jgi:hypothetical protein
MEEINYLYCICIEVPRLGVSRSKRTLEKRELRSFGAAPYPRHACRLQSADFPLSGTGGGSGRPEGENRFRADLGAGGRGQEFLLLVLLLLFLFLRLEAAARGLPGQRDKPLFSS